MKKFERTLILCKIHGLSNQENVALCYIPELISLQCAIHARITQNISQELHHKINILKHHEKKFGAGILPFKLSKAKKFIEDLYNEILKNHIPLPENTSENDLQYQIKNSSEFKNHFLVYEHKLKIQNENLTFFAKYLPWLGTVATYTLTLGFTLSTLGTLFGWGWSLVLFSMFGISKFLTTYADIAGGPERRLQILGFWIDRLISRFYATHGKFSLSRTLLNGLVMTILVCSSILTWYGAWQMIRCMAGMSYFPDIVASSLAGLFAWSSAGSSFGRIYSDLHLLLYRFFSQFMCFDNVKEIEKIDVLSLNEKLISQPAQDNTGSSANEILFLYPSSSQNLSCDTEIPPTLPHFIPENNQISRLI